MSERLVVVSSSHDREGSLGTAARLSDAGIPSSVVARRPDAFSRGTPRFLVSVPQPFANDAARHVTGWRDGGAYRTPSPPESEEELPVRRRRLAAFFALGLAFGLGHVYAREYVAGMILALGQLACLVLAANGVPEVLWAFPGLMALDAWGALRAVDRENDGARREPVSQLAATLPLVALVLAGATALLPPPSSTERPPASAVR